MKIRVFLSCTHFHFLVTETSGTKLFHRVSTSVCHYLPFVVPLSAKTSKIETCLGFRRTSNIVSKKTVNNPA